MIRRNAAGSKESGSGVSFGGQLDPRHGVREDPGRVRPLQQAVGPVAGGDPGVAPTRERAHDGTVVGGGGPQPDACLEVARALQSRRDRQALAQELVEARLRSR